MEDPHVVGRPKLYHRVGTGLDLFVGLFVAVVKQGSGHVLFPKRTDCQTA